MFISSKRNQKGDQNLFLHSCIQWLHLYVYERVVLLYTKAWVEKILIFNGVWARALFSEVNTREKNKTFSKEKVLRNLLNTGLWKGAFVVKYVFVEYLKFNINHFVSISEKVFFVSILVFLVNKILQQKNILFKCYSIFQIPP